MLAPTAGLPYEIDLSRTTPQGFLEGATTHSPSLFLREEDQEFLQGLARASIREVPREASSTAGAEEELTYNGKDLPQPSRLNPDHEIVTDMYSERVQCRVQRLLIEGAERAIMGGAVSTHFVCYSGFPQGVPTDCFENKDGRDGVYVLVDSHARDAGLPCCLAQVIVDSTTETFEIVPYAHPRGWGEGVVSAVLQIVGEHR